MAASSLFVVACVLLVTVSASQWSQEGQQRSGGAGGSGGNYGGGAQRGAGVQRSGGNQWGANQQGGGGQYQRGGQGANQWGGNQQGGGGRGLGREGQEGGDQGGPYRAEIYYNPEYYGYDSVFPGGKANFKSYRNADRGVGREGGAGGAGGAGGYGGGDSLSVVAARSRSGAGQSGGAQGGWSQKSQQGGY